MKIEIVNEEGTKKETDILFMLREKTVEEYEDRFDYQTRTRERENFYTYTDMDKTVEAVADVILREARLNSRMGEYFQAYGKPESDHIFEAEANREDVERLESALFKQHIGKVMERWNGKSGRAEDEPDIIALWDEQQANQDWQEGYESYHEFIEILKTYDSTMDENAVTNTARLVLNAILNEADWLTQTSYRDIVRTQRYDHDRYFYKRTMQMIVLRGVCTTVQDWKEQVESVKYYRYSNSEKGKREIAEQEERHRDMMTYMGESGLTSYSVDSNGTYTMWR